MNLKPFQNLCKKLLSPLRGFSSSEEERVVYESPIEQELDEGSSFAGVSISYETINSFPREINVNTQNAPRASCNQGSKYGDAWTKWSTAVGAITGFLNNAYWINGLVYTFLADIFTDVEVDTVEMPDYYGWIIVGGAVLASTLLTIGQSYANFTLNNESQINEELADVLFEPSSTKVTLSAWQKLALGCHLIAGTGNIVGPLTFIANLATHKFPVTIPGWTKVLVHLSFIGVGALGSAADTRNCKNAFIAANKRKSAQLNIQEEYWIEPFSSSNQESDFLTGCNYYIGSAVSFASNSYLIATFIDNFLIIPLRHGTFFEAGTDWLGVSWGAMGIASLCGLILARADAICHLTLDRINQSPEYEKRHRAQAAGMPLHFAQKIVLALHLLADTCEIAGPWTFYFLVMTSNKPVPFWMYLLDSFINFVLGSTGSVANIRTNAQAFRMENLLKEQGLFEKADKNCIGQVLSWLSSKPNKVNYEALPIPFSENEEDEDIELLSYKPSGLIN